MSAPDVIKPDVAIASGLAQKLHLNDILCVGIDAKITSAMEPAKLSYDVEEFVILWYLDSNELKVILPFSLSAYNKSGDNSIRLATFSVTIRADYTLKKNEIVESAHLAHYAGIMGYMHTWPYFRADIQYLSAKLGFPALVLPVIVSGQVPQRVSVCALPMKIEEPASGEAAETITRPSEHRVLTPQPKRKKLIPHKSKA